MAKAPITVVSPRRSRRRTTVTSAMSRSVPLRAIGRAAGGVAPGIVARSTEAGGRSTVGAFTGSLRWSAAASGPRRPPAPPVQEPPQNMRRSWNSLRRDDQTATTLLPRRGSAHERLGGDMPVASTSRWRPPDSRAASTPGIARQAHDPAAKAELEQRLAAVQAELQTLARTPATKPGAAASRWTTTPGPSGPGPPPTASKSPRRARLPVRSSTPGARPTPRRCGWRADHGRAKESPSLGDTEDEGWQNAGSQGVTNGHPEEVGQGQSLRERRAHSPAERPGCGGPAI